MLDASRRFFRLAGGSFGIGFSQEKTEKLIPARRMRTSDAKGRYRRSLTIRVNSWSPKIGSKHGFSALDADITKVTLRLSTHRGNVTCNYFSALNIGLRTANVALPRERLAGERGPK